MTTAQSFIRTFVDEWWHMLVIYIFVIYSIDWDNTRHSCDCTSNVLANLCYSFAISMAISDRKLESRQINKFAITRPSSRNWHARYHHYHRNHSLVVYRPSSIEFKSFVRSSYEFIRSFYFSGAYTAFQHQLKSVHFIVFNSVSIAMSVTQQY